MLHFKDEAGVGGEARKTKYFSRKKVTGVTKVSFVKTFFIAPALISR